MINIGICDDEIKMRRALRAPIECKLQLLGEDYEIHEFDCGQALLSSDSVHGLDILFLDIQMNGMNGIDTAKALRQAGVETTLIFITAYPDFVFQGYEVHAFHYILKPYDENKIIEVLEHAIDDAGLRKERYFTITYKSGIQKIPYKDIIAFQSNARKISIITFDNEIDYYGKLSEIDDTLPNYFVRIHNRYIVNLNYVIAIHNNECECKLHTFPISQTYRIPLEVSYAKLLLH